MTTAVLVAETAALALLALLVAGLLRGHVEILQQLDAVRRESLRPQLSEAIPAPPDRPEGPAANPLVGLSLTGDAIRLNFESGGRNTLLAFLSSGCLTCGGFWDALQPERRAELPGDARVVIVTRDGSEESPSRLVALAPPDLPLVQSTNAWELYDVPGSPYFVYIEGSSGAVRGEGSAVSWKQVNSLLEDALLDSEIADNGAAALEPRRRRRESIYERQLRADLALAEAGIAPDDPSLYGTRERP